MTLSDATQLQNRASESGKSTWLSANAGSGKTRVLTDRVARLLLKGISPQSVLCLTYTKAAASEMQNRLFKRLGAWAMLPDADLRKALQDLGETADVGLTHARTLFARAIETPGGLRIQTIHSFCASLLRRFPIEAGVSPHFIEMDEIGQSHLISDIIEDMADETAPEAIEALARHLTGEDAAALAKSVVIHRGAFQRPVTCDDVAAVFGLPAGADENLAIATAFEGSEAGLVRAVLPEIRKSTAKTMRTLAHALEELGPVTPSAKTLDTLAKLFLKADANVAKTGSIPTKSVQTALGPLCDELHSFMDRVAEAQNIRAALAATEKTLGLFTFATAFLPQYEHQKRLRGWMDFDDLIEKAEGLLSDPAAAAWVLFRLDGSFDHVLVDEAQDTSPAQWRIIDLLTQDLGSGIGVRPETRRTVFVVGDKKQSIYS
ncbi:MAG: UvrD-helicase domain-containing protein, partial [Alphaproteobacteria bacterium]|nr:UvrD-helicase domain-containing protein [Alphaproteobacteria bacterium]